ncbi:5-bromo-4-chloroindolyl phosphate hydrolysis protein [Epibacterium ulvae]|uniref:5-bromo-4-chloroindolyl phosphate hydrolysis protein n=1 Tax=Epibacterium ulvae TaxID=1156985 RepID=A0A1G5PXX3_9RHOB|nr:5-bromo-4-chloroindolyl phosphate hydrolysis family protein [Epibacterium ulvae]SCZ54051.1 5-bromo-4-chloroindolyl phosphate hydrolysis protein [Epibacterium ulvae]
MAQRFGGKFSPNGGSQTTSSKAVKGTTDIKQSKVSPVGLRANLMMVPPALLLLLSVFSSAESLIFGLAGAGLWAGAAFLVREGLRAEAAYHERRVATRPALPRKILAALLVGAGSACAALSDGASFATVGIYAVATLGLHLAAFGIDPLSNKGTEGIDSFQQNRVARVVDEAEEYLHQMADAIRRAKNRALENRVDQFAQVVRTLCRTVEEDPRDLTAARKYLTVYLLGARDATVKFADIFARSQDEQARIKYLDLLDDLEQNFAAKNQKMLLEDQSDLTIEIEVLRERLEREGITLNNSL